MLSTLLNVLFPSRCPVCDTQSDSHEHNPFCTACWNGIERYTGPACRCCGIPTVSRQTTHCESCTEDAPPFARILYYGIYEGALKEAVHLLKFGGLRRLSGPLGSLLAAAYDAPFIPSEGDERCVEGIIPVPLSPARLREREFNQTALLSSTLSKRLGIPLFLDVLAKSREVPPQTEVRGRERLKNIKNAFTVTGDVTGKRVLLVDDVITTGATVRECAKVLRKSGAESVTVVALARSLPKHVT